MFLDVSLIEMPPLAVLLDVLYATFCNVFQWHRYLLIFFLHFFTSLLSLEVEKLKHA